MARYERFSYVNTKEQAKEIKENLQRIGYKAYYKFYWVVMREIKE